MADTLAVVEIHSLGKTGMQDYRLSRIGDKWYVYKFDVNRGQIIEGNQFARHSLAGVQAICKPMTETTARRKFQKIKENHPNA